MNEKTPIQQFAEENKKVLLEHSNIDRELVDCMSLLLKYQPFQSYQKALDRLIQTRADTVLSPLATMDGTLLQEYIKGSMNGLILARDLPSVTLAAMKDSAGEDE